MSCPKCNSEMIEHHSKSVVLVEGKLGLFGKAKYKKTKAYACEKCGYVEFFLDNQ